MDGPSHSSPGRDAWTVASYLLSHLVRSSSREDCKGADWARTRTGYAVVRLGLSGSGVVDEVEVEKMTSWSLEKECAGLEKGRGARRGRKLTLTEVSRKQIL